MLIRAANISPSVEYVIGINAHDLVEKDQTGHPNI